MQWHGRGPLAALLLLCLFAGSLTYGSESFETQLAAEERLQLTPHGRGRTLSSADDGGAAMHAQPGVQLLADAAEEPAGGTGQRLLLEAEADSDYAAEPLLMEGDERSRTPAPAPAGDAGAVKPAAATAAAPAKPAAATVQPAAVKAAVKPADAQKPAVAAAKPAATGSAAAVAAKPASSMTAAAAKPAASTVAAVVAKPASGTVVAKPASGTVAAKPASSAVAAKPASSTAPIVTTPADKAAAAAKPAVAAPGSKAPAAAAGAKAPAAADKPKSTTAAKQQQQPVASQPGSGARKAQDPANRVLAGNQRPTFVSIDDKSDAAFCILYPNDDKCRYLYVLPPASPAPAPSSPPPFNPPPSNPPPSSPAPSSPAPAPAPSSPAQDGGPLFISPNPSFESLTEVSLDSPLLQIPQSFMGISHEWTHVDEINYIPGYKDVLKLLASYGSGPVSIRIGGGSTDKHAYVFPPEVYAALKQVYQDTGCRYILGVAFEPGDVELARRQMDAAKQGLPAEAIESFEIGNEPNFYEGTQEGGKTALEYVRCCFNRNWANFAKQLSCPCGNDDCCQLGQFSGPAWGHINVFPSTIRFYLEGSAKYLELVTVHWYKAQKEAYNTPVTLLEEAPIRKEMDNLRALVGVANSFGKPLRVAEMNSISNSGRPGVSNVFAAALWTLDGAFEVAATGSVGINLHQGSGQNLYTGIVRWYENGKLSPPVLRPPFYGMLAFQQAVAGGSKLLAKSQVWGDASNFKVWPLLDVNNEELRVVIINKHPSQAGNQTIRINRGLGYGGGAAVTRLVARGDDPLSATSGVTIGGYFFAMGGVQQGSDRTEWVAMNKNEGMQAWEIYMPPASAALVRVKKTNN